MTQALVRYEQKPKGLFGRLRNAMEKWTLAQGGTDLEARLARFDLVWRALGDRQPRARAIFLDNTTRPDRVTLRLDPDPDAAPDEGQ